MATTCNVDQLPKGPQSCGFILRWNLVDGETGVGGYAPQYPDKCVQVSGDFTTGGTVVIEGSNNSTDGADGVWTPLVDAQGNALSFTGAAIEQLLENPVWVRARITAGTSIAINVHVYCSVAGR